MKSENERNRLIQGGMDDKVGLSERYEFKLGGWMTRLKCLFA